MGDYEEIGKCTIDWEAEDEEDDEDFGPYTTPKEAIRQERLINQRMKQRVAKYKEDGEFDDRD